MYFVDILESEAPGSHGYLAGGPGGAVAVDPPADVGRVLAAAARRCVPIAYVAETHVHDDHATGGPELALLTGAHYLVPADAAVSYRRVLVHDGDEFDLDADHGLALRAVATPGHTPHHTSYVLTRHGRPLAAFTGGPLLDAVGVAGLPGRNA